MVVVGSFVVVGEGERDISVVGGRTDLLSWGKWVSKQGVGGKGGIGART